MIDNWFLRLGQALAWLMDMHLFYFLKRRFETCPQKRGSSSWSR